jgi:hypothetical protein
VSSSFSNNGTNNSTLSLTIGSNSSAEERTGTVVVKNNYYTYSIRLTQEGSGYSYSVSPSSLSFGSSETTKSVTLNANGYAYYDVYSKPSWCTVTFSGNGSETVYAYITPTGNSSTDSRSGTVQFTPDNGYNILNVSISQSGVEEITEISRTSVTLSKEVNKTSTVTLSANYNAE